VAEVEAFVWHDQHGNITAVGRAAAGLAEQVQPLVHGDRRVLKLSIAHEHLRTLHVTHKIDVATGMLAAREQRSPQRR
jgi:hypothetical protein